jgi:hypothetical protein
MVQAAVSSPVWVADEQSGPQPIPGPFAEPIGAPTPDAADAVERVATMTTAPTGVLLHAATHLIKRGQPKLGDMERARHANRLRQLLIQRGGVAAKRVQRCGRLCQHTTTGLPPIGRSPTHMEKSHFSCHNARSVGVYNERVVDRLNDALRDQV